MSTAPMGSSRRSAAPTPPLHATRTKTPLPRGTPLRPVLDRKCTLSDYRPKAPPSSIQQSPKPPPLPMRQIGTPPSLERPPSAPVKQHEWRIRAVQPLTGLGLEIASDLREAVRRQPHPASAPITHRSRFSLAALPSDPAAEHGAKAEAHGLTVGLAAPPPFRTNATVAMEEYVRASVRASVSRTPTSGRTRGAGSAPTATPRPPARLPRLAGNRRGSTSGASGAPAS